MVPDGWSLTRLDQISKKVMVGIASAATHAYSDSGVRMLRNLNIKEGWVDDSDILHIDETYEKQHKNKRLKAGDILTVRTGYPGISAVVPKQYEDAQCFTSLITRLDTNKALPDYICRFINSEYGRRFIVSGEAGGAQKNVNAGMLQRMPIPLPPLSEQNKISQILSIWDKAIITTEQVLANSQQQKKALAQQLLTGKKRLLDLSGTKFSNDWEEVRIKELLSEEKSRNKNGTIHRVLSVTNHSGFVLPEEQFSKRVASDDVSNYKIVRKGQYGYNPSRLNVGSFARLDSFEEGLLSPMYVVFSVASEKLNSDYFQHWMGSNEAKQRIAGSTQGSVRDSVGFDALGSFPFKLPPLEEQQKIAAVLTAADQEISALEQQISQLKTEKRALMQQLLTGKCRVKID